MVVPTSAGDVIVPTDYDVDGGHGAGSGGSGGSGGHGGWWGSGGAADGKAGLTSPRASPHHVAPLACWRGASDTSAYQQRLLPTPASQTQATLGGGTWRLPTPAPLPAAITPLEGATASVSANFSRRLFLARERDELEEETIRMRAARSPPLSNRVRLSLW